MPGRYQASTFERSAAAALQNGPRLAWKKGLMRMHYHGMTTRGALGAVQSGHMHTWQPFCPCLGCVQAPFQVIDQLAAC